MTSLIFGGLLAFLFCSLAIRDALKGQIGFVFAEVRQSDRPGLFWCVWLIELFLGLFFLWLCLSILTNPPACDDSGVCTVVIEVQQA